MNELALFAGAGGGILGGHLLGWKTVAACEIEDYPRETLLRRQADGILPRFPIWDDIRTFDGTQFRGCVDIISGGFPCQDISSAGKGSGITGERSGLWKEMLRIIDEVRPRFAFVENSPMLTSRGLGTVLGDLAEIGYDAEWCVLGADDVGAPHKRKRIWILADSNQEGLEKRIMQTGDSENSESSFKGENSSMGNITWWGTDPADMADEQRSQASEQNRSDGIQTRKPENNSPETEGCGDRTKTDRDGFKPQLGRVAHELALRLDELGGVK